MNRTDVVGAATARDLPTGSGETMTPAFVAGLKADGVEKGWRLPRGRDAAPSWDEDRRGNAVETHSCQPHPGAE